jgi:SOS-response transcriptional repressor LexA
MHRTAVDHAHVAKRKPALDSATGRVLKDAMKSHAKLKTQGAVAKAAGVSQSTISRMTRGEVDSQSDNVRRVCQALGIPLALLAGQLPEGGHREFASEVPKNLRTVPLISMVQAGAFTEAVDPYLPGDGHASVLCPERCGPGTFALKVEGDSMEPRYHEGDTIYVDPGVEAVQGSDVVVRLEDRNEVTFKRLVMEGTRRFLKPLNPRYDIVPVTSEAKVVGVVIAAGWATGRAPASHA